MVGGPGTALGVTGGDGDDDGPDPIAFVATTVNVYGVPLVRPPTTIGEPGPDADELVAATVTDTAPPVGVAVAV